MLQGEISRKLIDFTVENSHFEKTRNYISMSNAMLSVEELVNQYQNGFEYSENIALKCYKGYQNDLNTRILSCYPNDVLLGHELKAFDGLVKGHPDLWIFDCPGDNKSVLMDEWIPKDNKLPRKVYYQMQSYMLYSDTNKSIVIYESRETGIIRDFIVLPNKSIQQEINNKFSEVVKIISK